jgi:hypothetical protein
MSETVFKRIGLAGPLNIVWESGCSDGSDSLDWPIICLAELWRSGRVARLLTAINGGSIADSTALVNMLPALYERDYPELAAAATPCIYQVPRAEAGAVAGLVARGAQTGPWLVIGAVSDRLGLLDAFKSIGRFEHGLFWVGLFDQPAPALSGSRFFTTERNAHFVSGFDAASFLAYLLREISEFPPKLATGAKGLPCGVPAKVTPALQLYRWTSAVESDFNSFNNKKAIVAMELWKKAATARGEEYERLLGDAIRAYELHYRVNGGAGWSGAVGLLRLAERRSPREAELLVQKALNWIAVRPTETQMAHISAWTEADAFSILARSRTGLAADTLFEKSVKFLSDLPCTQYLADFRAASMAVILCRWADQERGSNSEIIFERGRQAYEEAQQASYKPDRQLRFAEALRQRGLALAGEAAQRMFADAHRAIGPLLETSPKDPALLQFAGMLAVAQGRLAEGESCTREAIALQPNRSAELLTTWAGALGTARRFTEAEAVFRQSEVVEPDSPALRKSWSSTMIWRARAADGGAGWWDRAKEQAEKAETIEAGWGAYNLACIAAELGDRESVEKWMSRSAEYGQMPGLSDVLRDESFEQLQNEMWFRDLLIQIFPFDPPLGSPQPPQPSSMPHR